MSKQNILRFKLVNNAFFIRERERSKEKEIKEIERK
jgi:hypothetical protein